MEMVSGPGHDGGPGRPTDSPLPFAGNERGELPLQGKPGQKSQLTAFFPKTMIRDRPAAPRDASLLLLTRPACRGF